MFEAVFEHATVAKLIVRLNPDRSSAIERCTHMVPETLGLSEAALPGKPIATLTGQHDITAEDATCELQLMHRGGYPVWVLLATAVVELDGDRLLLMQAQDISDRKRAEKQLQHMADHDSLTGLLTRRRLDQELTREIARARRHRHNSCLLLLELDGFTDVNDTLGHRAGDELLERISDALTEALREEDAIARMGGDEFALILPNTGRDGGLTVAEKLVGVIAYHGIAAVGRVARTVSASIGMTVIEGERAPSEHTLLAEAEAALHEAKRGGEGQVVVHVPRHDTDLAA